MPSMIPAFVFRQRARKAMKPVLSVLVLVVLIAMLPSLISQTLTYVTESDPVTALTELCTEERLNAMAGTDEQAATTALEELSGGMQTFLGEKGVWILLTGALTLLFGPVLALGQKHAMLKVFRGEEITAATGLERLPLFFKAIGLEVMTCLRLLLWELPGLAVMILGTALTLAVPTLGQAVAMGGLALMFVLMIRAMYGFRMAAYIMAESPEAGIRAALRRSTRMMNGRRMELFYLEFSFLGWRLVVALAQSLLMGLLGYVVGMTLGLLISFFLEMYVCMAEAAFYQAYAALPDRDAQQTAPEADAQNG